LQLQINFPTSHRKRNQLFATSGQLDDSSTSEQIYKSGSLPKKQVDFLLFQVNFTHQSAFYSSMLTFSTSQLLNGIIREEAFWTKKWTFCYSRLTLPVNQLFSTSSWLSTDYKKGNQLPATPGQLYLSINFLWLQVDFLSNMTSQWNNSRKSTSFFGRLWVAKVDLE
jgi:hypothetical protein